MSSLAHSLLQRRYLGVAGDWHGEISWIRSSLLTFQLSGITTIVQLGDFGMMGDIPRFLLRVNKYLLEFNLWLLVVPGNHENYDFINNDDKFDIDDDGVRWFKTGSPNRQARIGLLPRGYQWEQNDKRLMALGGASSIDYTGRTLGKTWWHEENITETEANDIIASINEPINVMFTHDAPRDVPTLTRYAQSTELDWEIHELAYAETTRARLDRVFRVAKPQLLMHGHWHIKVDDTVDFESHWNDSGEWSDDITGVFTSRIVGLDMNRSIDNLAVLDLSDLSVIILQRETANNTGKPMPNIRLFNE